MPATPFELLDIEGSTLTIDTNCSKLVIFTDDKVMIPSFNEHLGSSNRVTAAETPCGGIKNTYVPDMFPGTLSISGDGCYFQSIDGSYADKYLSAGQLSENDDIITSGSTGCAFKTADGKTFCTMDGKSFLVTPVNTMVSKFIVQNILDSTQTCTITIRCPDSVSSINLYNLDTCVYESPGFTNVQQTTGTVNSYTFTQTLPARSSKKMQVMVGYSNLTHTFKFTDDAFMATGLHNMEAWIGYYDTSDTEINFLLFTQTPEYITCVQDSSGNVTQFTIPIGSGAIYKGRLPHSAVTRTTSGDIPDCLNSSIVGSISKFLLGFKAISPSTATITSYVVPAISDDKILPKSTISSSYISSSISIRASPGEYTCASFVINADKSVNLSVLASDLICGSNTISASNVDLKYIKCWWQAGNSKKSTHPLGRFLTPELLLNDDSLIQVWGDLWNRDDVTNPQGRNFIKLSSGEYTDISISGSLSGTTITTISEMPVYDASYLQILNLRQSYNKQIWITLHVPTGIPAGTYTGTITLRSSFTVLKTIALSVQVLPITLPAPSIKCGIYYRPKLTTDGSISSEQKNVQQYTAELQDLDRHGVTNPTCYTAPSDSTLSQVLSLRQQNLTNYNIMYMLGRTIKNITAGELSTLISTCSTYGITSVYIYGYDEESMDTEEIRAQIQAVHDGGGYVFCAQSPTQALAVKDVVDLVIGSSSFTSSQITEFQATGHKVYSYGNPQSVPEYPLTFRTNYGLFLWQMGYSGSMVYAHQHNFGTHWNDFDNPTYRNHNFVYSTADGIVGTMHWEGLREGNNDLKYLAALQAAIVAHPGSTATTANNWLTSLKTTDLSTVDLDDVRGQMIDYILAITGA